MFTLDPVDKSFLHTAQHRFVYPIDLPVHPDKVWAGLTGAQPLQWCRMLTRVVYTSDPPLGEGTSRESEVARGVLKFHERFFAWDDSERRHAFFVERCNVPLTRAFAEEYHVAPTHDGCRLTWTFAFEENRRYRVALQVAMPGIRMLLNSLARDTERAFSRSVSQRCADSGPRP
jgi:Polyketide cyclase / dehydrase and lipid transport